MKLITSLIILTISLISFDIKSDPISKYKLLVDDGNYQESDWVKQIAVTGDDKYLLVSDFISGVKIYDVKTGNLINSFVGHSLEGEIYFDKKNNLLVSTGDKKIKIWDIENQSLINQINQGFHSQFMNNVYIDSEKKYVFAENTKYDFNTKKVIRKYEYDKMYFYEDKYYIFNKTNGSVKSYSVNDDKFISEIIIENYNEGIDEFFNSDKGILVIGYSNGIISLDITTGKQETIFFDRNNTYSNLSQLSNYDYSYDKQFFIAGSIQREGHFVVLKKGDESNSFEEIYREENVTGEIVSLHNSHMCIFSTPTSIQLFDLDKLEVVWKKSKWARKLNSIYISKDSKLLNINFGVDAFHIRTIEKKAKSNAEIYLNKYFDKFDEYRYVFKPQLTNEEIPIDIKELWNDRKQLFSINLHNGFKGHLIKDQDDYFIKGSEANAYSPVDGRIFSPSKTYYALEQSFKSVTFFKNNVKHINATTGGVIYHIEFSKDEKYAAFGGSDRIVTVVDLEQKKKIHSIWGNSYITTICFSNDNKYVFSGSLKNEILMHSVETGKLVRKFKGSNGGIIDIEITGDNKKLISVAEDCALRLWDVNTGKLLLTTYYDENFNFISFTPEGYFDESESFRGNISWNYNGDIIDFNQLFDTYYRPDIIQSILRGEDITNYATASIQNGIKTPPDVYLEIKTNNGSYRGVGVLSGAYDEIKDEIIQVKVIAKGTGGGIKGIRLYNNGKLVGENIREFNLTDESKLFEQEFTVNLSNRENELRAIGFSSDMTESRGTIANVYYKAPENSKPDMYIIAIGINQYKNQKYNLNYCIADMNGFVETITPRANKVFQNVFVKTISDREATRENFLNTFKELQSTIKQEDVFTFFYAGHGIALDVKVNSGEYISDFFYILSDVVQMSDFEKTSQEGISGTEMRQLLSEIKATKQVMFVDACNSGAFAEQFKVRGAAEENALAKLSRATGSVVFASTTKEQYALEFAELNHGIFTYVVLEALQGEGSLKNGQLTAASIKAYVDDKIPFYSEKYKGVAQYPTTFMWGQDFPLGMVE